MKKFLSFILILSVLCVCACNKNDETNIDTDTNTNTETVAISDTEKATEAKNTNQISENDSVSSNADSSNGSTVSNNSSAKSNDSNSASNSKTVLASNEYLSVSADTAISTNGKVTVTISTHDISSKEIYGMQFSVAFKGMSVESVSKGSMPNGWSCSVTDAQTSNANGGTTVLLDCDFSNPLDDREIVTIVFNSNGNGAILNINNNKLIQTKTEFKEIIGSNINL